MYRGGVTRLSSSTNLRVRALASGRLGHRPFLRKTAKVGGPRIDKVGVADVGDNWWTVRKKVPKVGLL